MVDARLFKGKTKVLTSTKSKEARTVDPKMQISADEYKEIRKRRAEQKSRYEQGKMSKAVTTKPQVPSRIMLNKWQWQKEKDYQHWLKEQVYQLQLKEERHERKQAELHWNCPFFRHCWNEGLKLSTSHDCLECSNQYWEFRQSQTNRRSIYTQDAYHHDNKDRRLKIEVFIIGWKKELLTKTGLIMKGKATREYIWQEDQWCPGRLTRSQKRRVQRLRNKEME